MPTARLIVNPTSGGGRGAKIAHQASLELQRRGCPHEVLYSNSPTEPGVLAHQAVADGCTLVVGVGGDGLTHAVANSLVGTPATLGIIPAGRGNDIARGLGIPLRLTEACELIAQYGAPPAQPVPRIDVGQAHERYFFSVALVGLAAEINRRSNLMGRFRFNAVYSILTVLSVFLSAPQMFTIRCDGHEQRCYSWLIAVGNSWSSGRGMQLVPGAQVDDGVLDACVAHGMGKWELLLRAFPRVFNGTHVYLTGIESLRGREMVIRSETPGDIYADGERLGPLPVTLRAIPQALSVIRPAQNR